MKLIKKVKEKIQSFRFDSVVSFVTLIVTVLTLILTLCIGQLTLNYSYKNEHLVYEVTPNIDKEHNTENLLDYSITIEAIRGTVSDLKTIEIKKSEDMKIREFDDFKRADYDLIAFLMRKQYKYTAKIPFSITKDYNNKVALYGIIYIEAGDGEKDYFCYYNIFDVSNGSYVYTGECGEFNKITYIQYKYNHMDENNPVYEILQNYEFLIQNIR